MTCSFAKFGCSIGIFLNSANLICRSTDISKYFRGSLRLRDNESQTMFSVREITQSPSEIVNKTSVIVCEASISLIHTETGTS